jgi:hypothetical protein
MKYTIHKNCHSSWLFGFLPHFGFTFKNTISFSALLENNCIYDLHNNDDYDTNKLYGVSTSYSHMFQSARIGWRCLDDKTIQIMAYTHDQGVFLNPQVLGTVNTNTWFDCKIVINDFSFIYSFIQNNKTNVITVPKKTKGWNFKYRLFFYFGGNEKAPHKMVAHIK